MNFKKFISGISALTIAASAFVSMAVTASAGNIADIAVPEGDEDSSYTLQNQSIGISDFVGTDYQIVYEADVYVGAGDYAEIFYIGGYSKGSVTGVGPKIRFDARETNEAKDSNVVSIVKDDSGKFYEINSNNFYSRYTAGHTVHVKIVTAVTNGSRIGSSALTVSAYNKDNEPFAVINNTRRFPSNTAAGGRAIVGRNLASNRKFSAVDLTVTGTATISNASFSLEKISVTQAADLVESFNADNGAAVYSATIENDTVNSLSNVTVTATTNDETPVVKTATDTITTLAAGSTVVLGVVIENKTADDLASVTIGLK